MTPTFDECKMAAGRDYKINSYITIRQPIVGEVIDLGEKEYFSMVTALSSIPSDLKVQLWDKGIDWEEISDFELFAILSRSITKEQSRLLFRDLDFSEFDLSVNKQNNELVLRSDSGKIIDKLAYMKIAEYIRWVHGIKPKVERAYNKAARMAILERDRSILAAKRRKIEEEGERSTLWPMISLIVNSPGGKYDYETVQRLNIVAFMDSAKRIQAITHADNLTLGLYMGNIDATKIDKKQLDPMRDL